MMQFTKPIVRKVTTQDGDFKVTMSADGVEIRPLRAKTEDGTTFTTWSQIYRRQLAPQMRAHHTGRNKPKSLRGARAT